MSASDVAAEENVNSGLAGIEYVGIAGASKECQDAVLRLIQFGDQISRATIISCSDEHCLLLTLNGGDLVAVKSGFSSGYGGEGPRRFSYVLQVLQSHGIDIEEYNVPHEFLYRIDRSALTKKRTLKAWETLGVIAYPRGLTTYGNVTKKMLEWAHSGTKNFR